MSEHIDIAQEIADTAEFMAQSYGPEAGARFKEFATQRVSAEATLNDIRGVFSDFMREVLYPFGDFPIGTELVEA